MVGPLASASQAQQVRAPVQESSTVWYYELLAVLCVGPDTAAFGLMFMPGVDVLLSNVISNYHTNISVVTRLHEGGGM
jgi:hypothetical protein